MKKNIIFSAMIVLAIIACTIFISDGLTYLTTSLMALAIMGTLHRNRSWVMKMTRWAKANPKKAQVFIAGLQMALMVLGVITGYNFKKIGYELSDTTAFVFSSIMVIGFFSVHFLPKRSSIAIPNEVNKNRLAYMSIALSSFVLMVITGNRIEEMYPNFALTHVVKAIDQAIYPDNSKLYADLNDVFSEPIYSENDDHASTDETSAKAVFVVHSIYDKDKIKPSTNSKTEAREKKKVEKKSNRLEKKKARMMNRLEKYRLAIAGGSTALSIILIILLLVPLCAGICLIIFGISGEIAAGYILLGGLIATGSIWGIVKAAQGGKRKIE